MWRDAAVRRLCPPLPRIPICDTLAPQCGVTPLILASEHGHTEAVRELLAKGADVEAKTEVSTACACALCGPFHSCTYRMRMAIFRRCMLVPRLLFRWFVCVCA
jgi:hypothetical protein